MDGQQRQLVDFNFFLGYIFGFHITSTIYVICINKFIFNFTYKPLDKFIYEIISEYIYIYITKNKYIYIYIYI